MSKETKKTAESDSSFYNREEINEYKKASEIYEYPSNPYTKIDTEEKSFNGLETDDKYTLNMPHRVKIRARIIND